MKRTALAVAVATAFTAPAAFGEIKVYGVVDVGLQSVDPGAGYQGSKTFLQSGLLSATRLGFKVDEDLGEGLKALATLEAGVDSDTGSFNAVAGGNNKLFGRALWAGLAGPFGTVSAGRQFSHEFQTYAIGELAVNAVGVSSMQLVDKSVWQDNLLKYTSPSLGGVTVLASQAFGEGTTAGTKSDGYTEFGVNYANGPVRVGAVKSKTKSAGVAEDDLIVAGQWNLGMATLYVQHATSDNGTTEDLVADALGVKLAFGKSAVLLRYGTVNDKTGTNADSDIAGVGFLYSLSKTTTLYAAWGTVDNNAAASRKVQAQAVNTVAAGEDPSVVAAGLNFVF